MKAIALLSAACLAFAAACSPSAKQVTAPPEQAKPEIALYALDCGKARVQDADLFADDVSFKGQARDLVDPCYLIRHPAGDLLWDTGLPDALLATPSADAGPFALTRTVTLAAQLQQLGLAPADIEFVSISHSHFDHVGNGGAFAGSTFLIDPRERAFMFSDEARKAPEFAAYAALEQAKTTSLEGDADHDVFGDGRVKIIAAPGHTPGHRVLLVQLAQAGPVLLTACAQLPDWQGKAVLQQPVPQTLQAAAGAPLDLGGGLFRTYIRCGAGRRIPIRHAVTHRVYLSAPIFAHNL